MKCFLGISNFLGAISSLSHSIVFLYFFALIAEEGFLISSCYSLEFCIQMGVPFFSPLLFTSLLFTAICKASSDSHCAFGTLHSNGCIFTCLLCFSLLSFSQLFVRPLQTAVLLFCISFLGDGFAPCFLYNVTNLYP